MKRNVEIMRNEFWGAPSESIFDRETVAAAIGFSTHWMNQKATTGGGIPFIKLGRRCLYRKVDVVEWIKKHGKVVCSTSEYCL